MVSGWSGEEPEVSCMVGPTWTAVIEAQALYEVLTHAGQQHFRQASNAPFVTRPIADKLGPFADNE